MITEADTCRKYVLPRLIEAGWDTDPHSFTEQKAFTDGRIVVSGTLTRRRPQKRADYLLRYTRELPLAVVEAKAAYKSAGDGLQQAKDYASALQTHHLLGSTSASFEITLRASRRPRSSRRQQRLGPPCPRSRSVRLLPRPRRSLRRIRAIDQP